MTDNQDGTNSTPPDSADSAITAGASPIPEQPPGDPGAGTGGELDSSPIESAVVVSAPEAAATDPDGQPAADEADAADAIPSPAQTDEGTAPHEPLLRTTVDAPAPATGGAPAAVAAGAPVGDAVAAGDTHAEKPGAKAGEPPKRIEPMPDGIRRVLCGALVAMTALMLAHLLWVWSFASRLIGLDGKPVAVRTHWLGIAFTPTAEWSLLLVVVFAAAAGSTAHSALLFANRDGHGHLEKRWVAWYLVRPGAAAVIGVLTYIILKAGFLGATNNTSELAFAAAVGGLAGLFTDTLMQKLRGALGASPFKVSASDPKAAERTGALPTEH
jgi:hypothetical protein